MLDTDLPDEVPSTSLIHARPATEPEWWRSAVIYQLYPRSWADTHGAGVGALPRITARPPHPPDLAVCAPRPPDTHGVGDLGKSLASGAGPRAPINLAEGARAMAMLRGRTYALPEDMTDLVPDVLRHRLVLTYEALSEGLTSDAIVAKIMAKIPAPPRPLRPLRSTSSCSCPRWASRSSP
mgnify:CR=1 FL=1